MNVKFTYKVEVEVKNDGLSRDAGRRDLSRILQDRLGEALIDLPWVIRIYMEEKRDASAR